MKKYTWINGTEVAVCFEEAYIDRVCIHGESLVQGKIPFYAVKLRNRSGASRILSAKDGTFVSFDGESAVYSHTEIEVKVRLKPTESGLSWRIFIKNKTEDLLEWAELMSLGVSKKLQDEAGGSGSILFPYNEGCLVTDMKRRERSPFPYIEPEYPSLGKYSIFPNMISSQFMAYIVAGKGIYLGMHDQERTTKHIDFCYHEESIKLQMRVFCNANYGEDYAMPFDCEMVFFEGEWQDACEIYRKWFSTQLPSGLVKIEEAEDLPSWYTQSPIVLIYSVRGSKDTGDMHPNNFFPYQNALPFLTQLQEATDSRVMALLMQWEGTAPWAPPYVWPPYGGEELFCKFVQEAHEQEMFVGVYCSGLGWTQQSNLLTEYNRSSEYEAAQLSEIICSNSAGEIESRICTDQRFGYDVCPALGRSKRLFADELNKVVKSGIDYVQAMDQNHGGCSYFCYSDQHGHVPAPGKWQQEETLSLLKGIDNGEVLLGCESAAAEPFLSSLRFSDNRFQLNYYLGLPVPMYAYVYHEYVNNFMGNQICQMLSKEEYNYTYRLAYSFTAGDMLAAVLTDGGEISHAWCDYVPPVDCRVDREVAITALKNFNAWRTQGGKKHLIFGKMVKPLPVECGKNTFLAEDGATLTVDEVLTSAYQYAGRKLQFIANYNLHSVTVSVARPVTVYQNPAMTEKLSNVKTFEIPALSAVAMELKESL